MQIQLPNDAVAVGYKETRPYHHEQMFQSESAGFTGTEREFFERIARAFPFLNP